MVGPRQRLQLSANIIGKKIYKNFDESRKMSIGTMENEKNFYINFDESREISIGTIGAKGTMGAMETL